MHFLCSTFGSAGDVFPMVGLAIELRRRGHSVTIATNAHFEPLAREHDIPFETLGTQDDYIACAANPDLWHPQRAFSHVFSFFRPVLKRQYELFADAAGRRDTAGVTSCFGFGALLARETHRLPILTLHLQPAVLWSDSDPPALPGLFGPRWLKGLLYRIGERCFIDPVVCPFLNEWRKELGLSPVRKITRWWNSPDGVLGMFPEWFAPPQPDWPQNLIQTDFPLWNHRSSESLSEDVARFLGEGDSPIVFTPGSANVHGRPFFEAAITACNHLRRRGIFLTEFPEQLPQPLPASIAHFKYVPLDILLPRVAAFVHHGGIGSTSQALLAGIPQVLMPLAHDQFDNGARIIRLGVGESIPAKRFIGLRLADALARLFGSTTTQAACRNVSERLAKRDGLCRSAGAIEQLVARKNAK